MKTFIVVDSKTEWVDAEAVNKNQVVMCKPSNPDTGRAFIVWDNERDKWVMISLINGKELDAAPDFIALFKMYRRVYKMYACEDI